MRAWWAPGAGDAGSRSLLAVLLVAGAAAGCASSRAPSGPPAELLTWSEGPVRWYMLAAELRHLRQIRSPAEALNFIESFWRLRDPDPSTPENPLRESFASRVEAANLLYGESRVPGSLTARGRALILLGPPPRLQVLNEPALTWEGEGEGGTERVATEQVPAEVWLYPPSELPPRYAGALAARGLTAGVELRFHGDGQAFHLVAGEEFLDLAALVALAAD